MDYYIQHNIGKAKHVVNYYNGVSTHLDGSPFYRIAIFKNLKQLNAFVATLTREGYKLR